MDSLGALGETRVSLRVPGLSDYDFASALKLQRHFQTRHTHRYHLITQENDCRRTEAAVPANKWHRTSVLSEVHKPFSPREVPTTMRSPASQHMFQGGRCLLQRN